MTVSPFYARVPKDPAANLAWRARMRRAALHDVGVQEALTQAAFSDVLFFFNAFCWLREPRGKITTMPFVTWPHQDPYILAMDRQIEEARRTQMPTPLTVKKSRGQGATWGYVCYDIWRWLRDDGYSVGYVTRNEDLVDSKTDEDTIMWKVAWEIQQLPFWMLPRGFNMNLHRNLGEHTVSHPVSLSYFSGYSATRDVGRGGRKTVFRCDEIGSEEFISGGKDAKVMASISHVTYGMCLVSTFGGETGVFYESAMDPGNDRLVTLDWQDNPSQNKLAYVMTNGKPIAVNPDDQEAVTKYATDNAANLRKLERRGHKMEGKKRSPWYDAFSLLPGATPRSVARELDMNPRGAVGKAFDVDVLDRMLADCCRPPLWQGKFVFDLETCEVKGLIRQDNGPLKLWFKLGLDDLPPASVYAAGCDISAGGIGEYSSNSTCCGIDRRIGEQVLEYAVMGVMTTRYAREAVAIAKWLHRAYLGWESSGIAASFNREVVDVVGYENVYYREKNKPGWYNGSDGDKTDLFDRMCMDMADGSFIPRSEDMIAECGEWEWAAGKLIHRPSKTRGIDVRTHGDRCVGGGVACLLCRDRPITRLDTADDKIENPPYGSLAWLHQREELDRLRFRGQDRAQPTIRDVLRD